MIREGQDSCHLGDPPMLNGNPATHNTLPSPKFHNRGENLFPACSSEEQASRTLPRFSAWLRILSTSSSLSLAWGTSCEKYSADRPRAPERSTDRICTRGSNDNNPSKIKHRHRTEMSAASTGRGFGSPIWLLWLSPSRQKQTWRSSLASMRERLAAGLRRTMSRLLKRSGSSSAKSCAAITSAFKRRPF